MRRSLSFTFIAITVLFPAGAAAQAIGAGMRLGWTTSHVVYDTYSSGRVQSLMAGGFLDIRFNRFLAFQPEVAVVQKGASGEAGLYYVPEGQPPVLETANLKWKYGYVETPLLLRLDVPLRSKLRPYAAAGPYLGLRAWCAASSSTSSILTSCDPAPEASWHRLDTGVVLAGGVRLRVAERYWLVTDARYDIGERSLFTSAVAPPSRNRSIILSVGIMRQRPER